MPPLCSEASAISGFPITMVATLSGSRMICAWSTLTVKGAAEADTASMANSATADATTSRLRCPNTADIELSNATIRY